MSAKESSTLDTSRNSAMDRRVEIQFLKHLQTSSLTFELDLQYMGAGQLDHGTRFYTR